MFFLLQLEMNTSLDILITLLLFFALKHFTARQRSCGKVMFSVMSVCQSFCSWGRSHVTITYDALDLTIQTPLPTQTWDLTVQGLHGHGIPLYRNPSLTTWPALLVTSGSQDWGPVQTCSLGPLLPNGADIW